MNQTSSGPSADEGAVKQRWPRRQCVGCRAAAWPADRVRIVVNAAGRCSPDFLGYKAGRGAWVHARSACLLRAAAGGLSRSFRRPLQLQADELAREIRTEADEEMQRLLRVNRPAGHLIVGWELLLSCDALGKLHLVLAAAETVTKLSGSRLLEWARADRVSVWGTEDILNSLMGLSAGNHGTLLGVTHRPLALALRRSASLARLTVDPASRSAQKTARRGGRPVEVQ